MNNTVAVIGAGIAGVTTAYYLVKAGFDVDLIDQEPYPAMRCSRANGGQVSVSNSEVWTTWSNIFRGAAWMFKKDAPLLIRPSLDWDKIQWLARFAYHTARNVYERNTVQTIQMGLESRQLYQDIVSKEKLNFDQSHCGILHFYKDQKYLDHAREIGLLYQYNECDWEIVTTSRILDIEPSLKDSKNIIGGAWTPSDWTGDIHKFCTELESKLEKHPGFRRLYNNKVDDLFDIDYYDSIVVAAGVGSVDVARSIGDRLPIYPIKGYSITIPAIDSKSLDAMPKTSLLDDQAKIVTSTLGNRLRVAGTAELAGENYDIRYDRIKPLLDWVHENLPKVDTRNYSSWACLRPMTPNMMPIVSRSTRKNHVYYNTGHGHLGWTLAPYTARKIVDQIIKDTKS